MSDGSSFIVYGISPYCSKGMLSDNPNVGIYEAQTSRTLDPNGGNPACHQGGVIVIEKKQPRNGYKQVIVFREREGKPGGGKGILVGKDVTYTLSVNQCTTIVYENHPQDGRYIELPFVSQTVSQHWGTGGNNTPIVVIKNDGRTDFDH